MFLCRTKKHVWRKQQDAEKCCNGYRRKLVFGDDIPSDHAEVYVESETGMRFTRIWVEEELEALAI